MSSTTGLPVAPRKKIADLQILRALAILWVLCAHLSLPAALLAMVPNNPLPPFWIGIFGVELFFVISGFIVTKTIIEGPSMSPGRFLSRRAFRLLPAILAFIVLSAVTALVAYRFASEDAWAIANLSVTRKEFLAQALSILGGYHVNRVNQPLYFNSAMWSLSVEFQFYAAFAAVLAVITALRLSHRLACVLIFSLTAALYALIIWERLSIATAGVVRSVNTDTLIYLTAWRFDFLALGALTYFVSLTSVANWRIGKVLAAAALCAPFAVAIACGDLLNADARRLLEGVGQPVIGICFALAVLLASRENAFQGKDGLLYRGLLWIGNRSYSLYLVHYPVMALVWVGILKLYPQAFSNPIFYGALQAALVLPISAILADRSFVLIEQKDKAMLTWVRGIATSFPRGRPADADSDRLSAETPK